MSPQPTSPAASLRPEAPHDTQEQPHEHQPSPSGAEASHPPFEPLFTLLSNTTSNATSHPRVHYIFADDEPTILPPSNSILLDLEAAPINPSPSTASDKDKAKGEEKEKTSNWAVKTASSLSPTFAVTSANLSGEGILKIEGVGREAVSSSRQFSKSGETKRSRDGDSLHEGEDVEGLVDEFRRRMGVLRRVVEQGEKSISPLIQQEGPHDGGDEKGGGEEDKVDGS